ncbi:MAG TPA: metalloregulator ArsR/SmtB family transcription factor [Ignavibacteria bacterium]|jgi:DNA-binding transcriptional ArsR family regulator
MDKGEVLSYKINDVFSALADEHRRNMLVMLSKGSKNVNEIASAFKISRPAVSKHLKILKRSNLVAIKKEGRNRYFSLNPKPVKEVFDWLKFYDKSWDRKLQSLKNYLEK